jgi:hypothetical protein
MAAGTEWPEKIFPLDFGRFDEALLAHATAAIANCNSLGEKVLRPLLELCLAFRQL